MYTGSLSDMPAVRTFALYATAAILLDFLFQITAFIALMSLDNKRYSVDYDMTPALFELLFF